MIIPGPGSSPGPTLASESVIRVSPLPVLGRGDASAPPLLPFPTLRGVILPQTEPPTSSLYPLLGLLLPWQWPTNCNPHPYSSSACSASTPPPTWAGGQEAGGRAGVPLGCCTAVALTFTPHLWSLTPSFMSCLPWVKFWSLDSGRL